MWILSSSKEPTIDTHHNDLDVSPENYGLIEKKPIPNGEMLYEAIYISSAAQLCPTLCDPMDCSTPGFPVHHQLPEPTQTHVHWIGDAIQPSHSLLSPSPLAFNLSQHQGLLMSQFFASGGQSIGVSASESVLPMNIQVWFPLGFTGWISLQSKQLSRVTSPTPRFKSINSSALNFVYSPTLASIYDYWKNHSFDRWTFVGKVMSLLFNMLFRLVIAFSSKEQVSFNFMATVTICSDFGVPQNKVCHCFHRFPVYFPIYLYHIP